MEALEGHFPLQFSKNETVEGSRQVCSILYFKLKMNSYELLLGRLDWNKEPVFDSNQQSMFESVQLHGHV